MPWRPDETESRSYPKARLSERAPRSTGRAMRASAAIGQRCCACSIDARRTFGVRDLDKIRIQFTLFSAFYSPLISAMSGGFLKAEGLDPEWSVAPPGVSALAALNDGSAHVVQSALSQGFTSLNKGETPGAVHFAQINEMDGFFLTGREADPAFTWKKLEGAQVVMFRGGQPLDMFKYACHKAGIAFDRIKPIGLGGAGEIDKAFRQGQG